MYFYKVINNLSEKLGPNENYIYGGIDMAQLKGSFIDMETKEAIIAMEEQQVNENLLEITQEEYNAFYEITLAKIEANKHTAEDRLSSVEIALAAIMGGAI